MKWKKQIQGLKAYQPGKTIKEVKNHNGLDCIVKLASNENPFGCPPEVLGILRDSSNALALYPDGSATKLRGILSSHLELDGNQLIFGNGSDELIKIISRSLLHKGTNTVMATPTFPQYRHNALIEGCEIREIPLLNGAHDLEGMLAAIDCDTAVVWLCSPNNPTGIYISENRILDFLERVPEDILVVLDEAYYEYVVADDYYHSPALVRMFKNLIVLRTFSKVYGLASLRIGYGFAHPGIIMALEPVREPFNVNSLALAAAEEAVKNQQFVETAKILNRQGMEQYEAFCKKHKLKFYSSQGNFILIDFSLNGDEIFQYLLENGFIVRSGQALGFPTTARITIGTAEQNRALLDALKVFLEARKAMLEGEPY
ncbi:histidinol-phosphate transaminase [Bacillus massilinigeriensis]|uniref:histidinol-phosphate transaminase n=1 Tax=Bacillus mediterraneensis TaxID=1805474 RepID=UPI0008F8EE9F|nr:histidinol-phosphate transaminase [Bacillus mediterraneensis]